MGFYFWPNYGGVSQSLRAQAPHPPTNNMTKSPPVTKRERGADTTSISVQYINYLRVLVLPTSPSPPPLLGEGRKYRIVCILVPLLVVTSPHFSTFTLGSSRRLGYPIRCPGLLTCYWTVLCQCCTWFCDSILQEVHWEARYVSFFRQWGLSLLFDAELAIDPC